MRKLLKKSGRPVGIAVLALAFASMGFGATLYTFGLPSGANVNGGTRANFDAINSGPSTTGSSFINGDSFVLPGSGSFLVTQISVFAVGNFSTDTAASFAAEFNSISLYEGAYGDYSTCGTPDNCPFSVVSTAPAVTLVSYTSAASGTNCPTTNSGYLSTVGNASCIPIFRIDFTTTLVLTAGNTYSFAADGAIKNTVTGCVDGTTCGWYNLGSTIGNGTGSYSGANPGHFTDWDSTDLTGGSLVCDGASHGSPPLSCSGPNVNFNVIVTGQAIPEPTPLTLSGLGIAALVLAGIGRRKLLSKSAS